MQEIADLWIWIIFWAGAVLGGFIMGFVVGRVQGAKNYEMILKHLESVWNARDEADKWLGEIEELADAIRKGSE